MRKKTKSKSKSKGDTDNKSSSFHKIVEEKIVPALTKFANFPILLTIRDTFGLLLPLIIVGSVGLLGSTFIFGGQNNTGTVSTSIIGWLA